MTDNTMHREETDGRRLPAVFRVRGAIRGWHRVLAVLAVVYLLLFTIWQLVVSRHVDWAWKVDSISAIPPDIILIALLVSVVRTARLDDATRRAWFWILLASIAQFLGNVTWAWYELVLGMDPFPSWADAAYLWYFPLMLIGLLSFPIALRKRTDGVTLWLDKGMILVASGMAIWYFILGPIIEQREPGLASTALAMAYPLGEFLLLYAVVRIVLRGSGIRINPAILLILPGVLAHALGDLFYSYLNLSGQYATGHWIDVTWVLGNVLFALAAFVQLGQPAGDAGQEQRSTRFSFYSSLLPYGAMVLGYGLLVVGGLQGSLNGLDGLIVGAVLLSALVIARQVIAFNDNHRLLNRSMALGTKLQDSEARFRSLVQHGSDIILLLDADANIKYISPSVRRISGVPSEELLNQRLLDRIHPDDLAQAQKLLAATMQTHGYIGRVEVRILHAEGSWMHIEAYCSNHLETPSVEGIVINARDITDRKMLEARLVAQANHDALTGLPNRKYFVEQLEESLREDAAGQVAVLFLDLDGFKDINDSLGHSSGDELLVTLSERLKAWAEPGMTPARLGGDEFTVLLDASHQHRDIRQLTRDLQRVLDQPYRLGDVTVNLSPSIGIATGVPGVDSPDDVLRGADTAMYLEKARRKNLPTRV